MSTIREQARAFLERHAPEFAGPWPSGHAAFLARAKAWQRAMASEGWSTPTWPERFGGKGLESAGALAFAEEVTRFDVPVGGTFIIGTGLVGPTLIVHGTDEQRARWMEDIRTGERIWCQLWSEPNAGSDLAGLRTRAERISGGFVLNGQKVWTSGAHQADWGICVARSDQDVPKHRGITCFGVDMHAKGVTVRPLRQITGDSEFNEVFLDDVFVPEEDVIGEVNDGWRVAITVLMNERAALVGERRGLQAGDLVQLALKTGAADDPAVRDAVVRTWMLSRIFDLVGARSRAAVAAGGTPGPEASIGKSLRAKLGSAVSETALQVLGAAGMLSGADGYEGGRWSHAFLRSRGPHIAGGTDEIQKNIVGERVLGLPKEPQVDRDVPFREIATR